MTLNGHEFSVQTATEMGYTTTRIPQENNTFAYILKVPFNDPVVEKLVRLSVKYICLELLSVTQVVRLKFCHLFTFEFFPNLYTFLS